jgi:SH3 domain-containing YSC84-like protein 1
MRRPLQRGTGSMNMLVLAIALSGAILGLPAAKAANDDSQQANTTINQALSTLKDFMQDPDLSGFRNHVKEAKGVLIVPKLLKGAFMFGVEGGNGVLLVRDEKTGAWSEPAFYELSSVSFGLQAGVESSESILIVQTPKGVDTLLTSTVKLGGDVSAAVGSQGGGMEGSTSTNLGKDFVTYSRTKGAFAGVSLEGASIRTRDELNQAYYGSSVRPGDIVLVRNVTPNPQSQPLREAVVSAAGGQ